MEQMKLYKPSTNNKRIKIESALIQEYSKFIAKKRKLCEFRNSISRYVPITNI